jgi:hypothetical protein
MKKYFSKVLFLFGIMYLLTTNINAFELTYSEWSETYPEGIDEIFIEREDRYYWYKDNIVNVEYLKLEDIQDKQYDENDIKYYTSEELLEKPEEYNERVINEITKEVNYTKDDVKGILITTENDIKIAELIVRDLNGNKINCNTGNSNLHNGNINDFIEFNNKVKCYFNEKISYDSFSTFLSLNDDSNNKVSVNYSLITENDDIIYHNDIYFSGKIYYTVTHDVLLSNLQHLKKYYTYTDKLYKTFNVEKENVYEYYANLDGYIKDEESKKTFYRYITNDYIIVDENDDLVIDEDHCHKNFCKLIYLIKQEETEIIKNPKTYDSIINIFIILIISFLTLILIVKKCHTNKKSNIVESI